MTAKTKRRVMRALRSRGKATAHQIAYDCGLTLTEAHDALLEAERSGLAECTGAGWRARSAK